MEIIRLDLSELPQCAGELKAADYVYLNGTVYTARDAAHSRFRTLIEEGKDLPFELCGAVIYYAGPTPTKNGGQIGSFGPTTSTRMDAFTPMLLDRGLSAMIGKGNRSADVIQAIVRNKAVYFCAGGGLGALISKSIVSCEEIAFKELGCESVKRLTVKDLPVIVGIDASGGTVFNR